MIGIVEAIGYGARAASVNDTGSLGPYIIQSIFILVPPAFFAATIYMTLSRTIRCVKGEHLSLVRITWLTKVFVIGDILSFWVQGGSAGLTIHSNTAKIGQDMVIGGLGIQIISFGVFFLTAVIFHIRISKQPSRASCHTKAPWKQTLHMLYAVSVLILIRSVFRVVEYVQGQSGYSLKHEWTLYVFDSVPMFVVTVLFYARYPSEISFPSTEDEESQEMQTGENAEFV
jgi:hypothetical protein